MYKYCDASSYTFVQYGFLLRECACTVRGGIILHMTSCSKRGITRSMFKFRFYWGPCKNLFLCDGVKLSYKKLKLTCNHTGEPERTHGVAGRRDNGEKKSFEKYNQVFPDSTVKKKNHTKKKHKKNIEYPKIKIEARILSWNFILIILNDVNTFNNWCTCMYKKKRRELEITFYYGLRTRTQTWTLIYISKYHFMKL